MYASQFRHECLAIAPPTDGPLPFDRRRPTLADVLLWLLLTFATPEPLRIYGGPAQHFLGCYGCPSWDPDSIHNPKNLVAHRLESATLVYTGSPFSPCNPDATDPPRLETYAGRAVGVLTVNRRHPQRVPELVDWITAWCGEHRYDLHQTP